jgi:hypothetical protein
MVGTCTASSTFTLTKKCPLQLRFFETAGSSKKSRLKDAVNAHRPSGICFRVATSTARETAMADVSRI